MDAAEKVLLVDGEYARRFRGADGRSTLRLLEQGPPVVVFGISTGAPTAAYVAAQRDVAAVMLEAPLILGREPSLWLADNLGDVPILNAIIPPASFIAEFWIAPVLFGERYKRR